MRPNMIETLAGTALLALAAGSSHAATLDVPSAYATIQDAVDAAADGDVVMIADGTYAGDVDVFSKSITIQSASDDPTACIVDGGFFGFVLFNPDTDTTLRGMTIRNCNRGVEINADASATIENCVIEDCSNLGGLFMNGTRLTMADCIVQRNETVNAGAGMLISQGDVDIRDGVQSYRFGTHLSCVSGHYTRGFHIAYTPPALRRRQACTIRKLLHRQAPV